VATAQRIKVLGAVSLTFAAMVFAAAGALGLITVAVPAQMSSAVRLGLEILPWARVALAVVLAGWVISRWAADAE
jgi:hypothetical protein